MLSLRNTILVAVCLQNAGYTLIRKYSTMTENVSSKEILLVGEIIKMIVAGHFLLVNAETGIEPSSAKGTGIRRLQYLIVNSSKMLVLAMIYAAMNILSFVALQYIGAGEFSIVAQLKILTTAGFSVAVLRTSLSWTKWRALFQLVFGCILVASPHFSASTVAVASTANANNINSVVGVSEGLPNPVPSQTFFKMLGYGAVLSEVVLSGFASIYFERVVKSTTEVVTIWERNFQLAFYSMIVYILYILYEVCWTGDRETVGTNWSFLTFSVSFLGALGGLLVAATLKYADSILKTMASAGAIVLSTILGHVWMDGPMDMVTCIGGITTILSIMNYSWDYTPVVPVPGSSSSSGSSINMSQSHEVGPGPGSSGSGSGSGIGRGRSGERSFGDGKSASGHADLIPLMLDEEKRNIA